MSSDPEGVYFLHTPNDVSGEDYRFAGPVQECLCGGDMFHIVGSFDSDGEIGMYILDGICWSCGAIVTLPTPMKPNAFVTTEEDEQRDD